MYILTALYRINLREDDHCEHGEMGTPEHMLFHGRLAEETTREERKALRDATVQRMLQEDLLLFSLNNLASKILKL